MWSRLKQFWPKVFFEWLKIIDGGHITEDDFDPIKVLGRGAFGKVILTEKRGSGELYAVKIMNKADVIEKNQIDQIKLEKDILIDVHHPF